MLSALRKSLIHISSEKGGIPMEQITQTIAATRAAVGEGSGGRLESYPAIEM